MIRPVERDETLRVLRRVVDPGRVLDPDDHVDRTVEDHESAVERPDPLTLARLFQIIEEFLSDPEGATGQFDLRLTLVADLLDRSREQVRHVGGIGGRADRGDRHRGGNGLRCLQNGSATQ